MTSGSPAQTSCEPLSISEPSVSTAGLQTPSDEATPDRTVVTVYTLDLPVSELPISDPSVSTADFLVLSRKIVERFLFPRLSPPWRSLV